MRVAIDVPDALYEAGERLALQLKVSRSRLYSDAIARYLSDRGAAEITARLNRVYPARGRTFDATLSRVQLKTITDEAW